MAVTIRNCPHCHTMLFDDTVQCPACKHILDSGRHTELTALAASSVSEKACPQCGEMVRAGLVRCWNCSSFMRDEMADAYRKMKESPQPVIYSLLPDDAELHMLGDGDGLDDDDYELGSAAPSSGLIARVETPADPPNKEGGDAAAHDAPPPDVAHSVATGGDVLLEVAKAQELEERHRQRRLGRRAQPRSATGILVFCPNGHRIEVDQRYRGLTGRCPKCKSPFFVPVVSSETESAPDADVAEAAPTGFGKYSHWLSNVHVHVLNPERFKLKAGSLKNDFQLFDFALATDEVLAVTLTKRKGAANLKSRKLQQDREALQDALRESVPISEAPAAGHFAFTGDQAGSIAVVQPAAYAHESMFAGIPVFGEGRIAVRLPAGDDPKNVRFASFTLSEFREFSQLLRELFGIEALGENEGVPLTDSFSEGQCHYSERKLSFLEDAQYHKADSDITLQLVGRKCQACGLIVSEDMRKKEKIGGANGKAIAKAKCPKCGQKFGDISLFAVEQPATPPAEDGESEPAAEVAGVEG
ncbi:MAG: hypothetical protein ACE5KM_06675 [Planctomycetaceae bacterium]